MIPLTPDIEAALATHKAAWAAAKAPQATNLTIYVCAACHNTRTTLGRDGVNADGSKRYVCINVCPVHAKPCPVCKKQRVLINTKPKGETK